MTYESEEEHERFVHHQPHSAVAIGKVLYGYVI